MSKNDIDKAFISPYDLFLSKFDKEHQKSASQLKEINKHKRIAILRDNPNVVSTDEEIWEDF